MNYPFKETYCVMDTVYNLWLTMQEPTQKSEHFETVSDTTGLVLYNKNRFGRNRESQFTYAKTL